MGGESHPQHLILGNAADALVMGPDGLTERILAVDHHGNGASIQRTGAFSIGPDRRVGGILPGQSQQQPTAEKDPDPCPASARGSCHTSHGGD